LGKIEKKIREFFFTQEASCTGGVGPMMMVEQLERKMGSWREKSSRKIFLRKRKWTPIIY
jgi:hypothetical protein